MTDLEKAINDYLTNLRKWAEAANDTIKDLKWNIAKTFTSLINLVATSHPKRLTNNTAI